MDFAIAFDYGFTHPDYAFGSIKIGMFTDYFRASTHFWTMREYGNQWQEAISLIINEGTATALITDLTDPTLASFIMWWPLWRNENHVIIQNQLLLLDELDTPFRLESPYEQIGAYPGNISDEGEKISEWQISISDMKKFWKSINPDTERT